MCRRTRFARLLLLGLSVALLAAPVLPRDGDWRADLAVWRQQHVVELLKPDGWLSLAGLEWLQPGDNSFGSALDNKIHLRGGSAAHVGVLRLEGETVRLLPPAGGFPAEFRVAEAPPKEQILPADPNKDKTAIHLTVGTLNMYVIRRAERFALRIKDSKSPALVGFRGLNWYEPDGDFRVKAKWIPYTPQKSLMLATMAGTTYSLPVPGAAEFALNGKTYRLEPVVEDPAVPKLFFILRDSTSATTTYEACRFLYTGVPSNGLDKDGELWLDFNRLENPPCAYTAFATCPYPPKQNRLPIPLPVGQKRYHD